MFVRLIGKILEPESRGLVRDRIVIGHLNTLHSVHFTSIIRLMVNLEFGVIKELVWLCHALVYQIDL